MAFITMKIICNGYVDVLAVCLHFYLFTFLVWIYLLIQINKNQRLLLTEDVLLYIAL